MEITAKLKVFFLTVIRMKFYVKLIQKYKMTGELFISLVTKVISKSLTFLFTNTLTLNPEQKVTLPH